ncbi:signal peptidase I, partial [Clavibacter phaseoli]
MPRLLPRLRARHADALGRPADDLAPVELEAGTT